MPENNIPQPTLDDLRQAEERRARNLVAAQRGVQAAAVQRQRFILNTEIQDVNADNIVAVDPRNANNLWAEFTTAVAEERRAKAAMETDKTIWQYFGIIPMREAAAAMKSHPNANIYGIELEIEGWPMPLEESSATGFRFTTDGSLRNSGIEAISLPNSKEGTLKCAKMLWDKYGINEHNFSERTSIHVHANVLNFTTSHLQTLMLVYATLEDLLFEFIGQERYKNIFCVPWSEAGVSVARLKSILESPRGWQKYTALNLAPVRVQGTVEFRHMEGHANIERLTNWLNIIDDIMTFSVNNKFDDVYKVVSSLNNTSEYSAWAASVLKSSIHIFNSESIRTKLARGVIEAKLTAI